MTFLLPILAVAFTALCVWLAVRIINRRERWAKWTLAAVVALPVLYVASFGPACWLASQQVNPNHQNIKANHALVIYCPLATAIRDAPYSQIGRLLMWWMTLGTPKGHVAIAPVDANGTQCIVVDPANI